MATEQTETGSEQGDDLNLDVNLDEFSLDDEQLWGPKLAIVNPLSRLLIVVPSNFS